MELRGKEESTAQECESKKGRAEESASCLTSACAEPWWGGEEPLCETGYSWDAKGLASSSDRL